MANGNYAEGSGCNNGCGQGCNDTTISGSHSLMSGCNTNGPCKYVCLANCYGGCAGSCKGCKGGCSGGCKGCGEGCADECDGCSGCTGCTNSCDGCTGCQGCTGCTNSCDGCIGCSVGCAGGCSGDATYIILAKQWNEIAASRGIGRTVSGIIVNTNYNDLAGGGSIWSNAIIYKQHINGLTAGLWTVNLP